MFDEAYFKELSDKFENTDFSTYFRSGNVRDYYCSISTGYSNIHIYATENNADELKQKFAEMDEFDKYSFLRQFIRNNIMIPWEYPNNPYKCHKLHKDIIAALNAFVFHMKIRNTITSQFNASVYTSDRIYSYSGTYDTSFDGIPW